MALNGEGSNLWSGTGSFLFCSQGCSLASWERDGGTLFTDAASFLPLIRLIPSHPVHPHPNYGCCKDLPWRGSMNGAPPTRTHVRTRAERVSSASMDKRTRSIRIPPHHHHLTHRHPRPRTHQHCSTQHVLLRMSRMGCSWYCTFLLGSTRLLMSCPKRNAAYAVIHTCLIRELKFPL